jgi:hypothetical protein
MASTGEQNCPEPFGLERVADALFCREGKRADFACLLMGGLVDRVIPDSPSYDRLHAELTPPQRAVGRL